MHDIHNWYRLIGLYIALYVIFFLMEWYKYKHSTFSWWGFKENGMYTFTYMLTLTLVLVIGAIITWAVWPLIINH